MIVPLIILMICGEKKYGILFPRAFIFGEKDVEWVKSFKI